MPDDPALLLRIAKLERMLHRLSALERKILPIISLGEFDDFARTDTVTTQRTEECVVTTDVDVEYELLTTDETRDENGDVVRTCFTFRITTIVSVSETCRPEPGEAVPQGSTTHVTEKQFCVDAGQGGGGFDTPKTGVTTAFDGKHTETLVYPHGTRVTIELEDGVVTIRVSFADGTSTSLVVPPPS